MTRDSNTRSLEFDTERVKYHLENYAKKRFYKIFCKQRISDNNDSNDSNRKDLFKDFLILNL